MGNSIFSFGFARVSEVRHMLSFLLPATKLGQGNIFTGVCDSVNEGVSARGEGDCSRRCLLWGGLLPGGCLLPPGQPLLWAVRILLECILVVIAFYWQRP